MRGSSLLCIFDYDLIILGFIILGFILNMVLTEFTIDYGLLFIMSLVFELCNSRLLKSHMRLKKNRPYNHCLKSQ